MLLTETLAALADIMLASAKTAASAKDVIPEKVVQIRDIKNNFLAIEPLLGTAIAINLGYVLIPWFHYLRVIGKSANDSVNKFADNGSRAIVEINKEKWKDTSDCIDYLASLGDENAKEKNISLGNKKRFHFLRIYIWQADRYVAIFSIIVCYIFLVLGSAHELSILRGLLYDMPIWWNYVLLWSAAFFLAWPLGMSAIAKFMQGVVTRYIEKAENALIEDKRLLDAGQNGLNYNKRPDPTADENQESDVPANENTAINASRE